MKCQKILTRNNVTISTLETQMSSLDENINRLKVDIDVLTSKKQNYYLIQSIQ